MSMLKHFASTILILTCLTGCQKQSAVPVLKFNEAFTRIRSLTPPDSLAPSDFFLIARYASDHEFVYSELFSRSLFKLDLNTSRAKQWLSRGPGPGQYSRAFDFYMTSDTLYFNDGGDNRFQALSLNTGEVRRRYYQGALYHASFTMVNGKAYFHNWSQDQSHYIVDGRGHKYGPVPPLLQKCPHTQMPLPIYHLNDQIFFVNRWERRLFALDPATGTVSETPLPFIPGRDFSDHHDQVMDRKKFARFTENHKSNISFVPFNCRGERGFLMATIREENQPVRYHAFTSQGRHLMTIESDSTYILDSRGSRCMTYEMHNDIITFVEYELKEHWRFNSDE